MVPRDRYSRVSLVLQSFPETPITFARAVTRDVSKRFYYLDRFASPFWSLESFEGIFWRYIFRGTPKYVFSASSCSIYSLQSRNVMSRERNVTFTTIHDEIIYQWDGVSLLARKRFRLKISRLRTRVRSSRFSLRPAKTYSMYCNRGKCMQRCVLYRHERSL